jgi:F0F1-type ATP synthase membrane subunit c/vacuolar-type H+-ATPase subunit K
MSKSKEYVEKLKRVKIKYIYVGVLLGLVAIYGPAMAVGILLGMGLAYVAKMDKTVKDIVE